MLFIGFNGQVLQTFDLFDQQSQHQMAITGEDRDLGYGYGGAVRRDGLSLNWV